MKKILLIDYDLCGPRSCGQACITKCPITLSNARKKSHQKKDEVPVRYKKSADKMIIISEFCIQCGVCVNVCPRKAIYSMYLLDEPDHIPVMHRYPPTIIDSKSTSPSDAIAREFRLYGLPTLIPGRVTGLCGPNGIGKSTVLNILSGTLLPNFGDSSLDTEKVNWKDLIKNVKEAEMRTHFKEVYGGDRHIAYKKQVLQVLFEQHGELNVLEILTQANQIGEKFFQKILDDLDIRTIADRKLQQCSGGELQRFAIASVLIQDSDLYLIDEPCTFLDVKKRIALAELLRARSMGYGSKQQYPVLVVEHDLAILDYISDVVHLFYGKPHEFGVLTKVQTTKGGINAYLNGYLKTENIQFRKKKIGFRRSVGNRVWENARVFIELPELSKTFESFRLDVGAGTIYEGEILGIVGENGTGKSTFAKILAGELVPDQGIDFQLPSVYISYKPQYILKDYEGTVQEFLMERSQNYDFSDAMVERLYAPLGIDRLFSRSIMELSGGELQRVYIAACLAKRADLYILDESSAYLDVEERLHISGVIRALTKFFNATTICIEHDIQIADALADRLLIFKGEPGVHGQTMGPLNKREGMNEFLKILDITFRRDDETGRARINKKESNIDKRQRRSNEYFYAPRK